MTQAGPPGGCVSGGNLDFTKGQFCLELAGTTSIGLGLGDQRLQAIRWKP
jgi:hypothetical protein